MLPILSVNFYLVLLDQDAECYEQLPIAGSFFKVKKTSYSSNTLPWHNDYTPLPENVNKCFMQAIGSRIIKLNNFSKKLTLKLILKHECKSKYQASYPFSFQESVLILQHAEYCITACPWIFHFENKIIDPRERL